jgi:hypothetical protein
MHNAFRKNEQQIEVRVCPLPFGSKPFGYQFAIQKYED